MTPGKVIILSAPSGAGKTTIARKLLEADLGLEFSISACSRAMRAGEQDGVDYFFLTPEEFRKRIASGDFLEWQEVYPNHYYGTLRSELNRIWAAGKQVLFDVDAYGGRNIKKEFGDQAFSIFIEPPDLATLQERLEKRSSDAPEKIAMRLAKAEEEMSLAPDFDIIIVNDNLEAAIDQTLKLTRAFLKL